MQSIPQFRRTVTVKINTSAEYGKVLQSKNFPEIRIWYSQVPQTMALLF
tara:strand:- start:5982 stop:6128 length:147 start_codon:yes stop_codon:yes gene_type:complete